MLDAESGKGVLSGPRGAITVPADGEITFKLVMLFEGKCEGLGEAFGNVAHCEDNNECKQPKKTEKVKAVWLHYAYSPLPVVPGLTEAKSCKYRPLSTKFHV